MEQVQAQSMHITDTKPLCSSNDDNGEEISKQLENELLYGGQDDGDALSDDATSEESYRLRVSDDENDDKIDSSKIVENTEKDLVEKTELEESTAEVLATNGETLQLDKINGSSDVFKNGQDSTEDYVIEQDKTKFNSEETEKNLENSDKPVSDIDSDNEYHDCHLPEKDNDEDQIDSKLEDPQIEEDSSKTEGSPSDLIDKLEKEIEDSGDVSGIDDKIKDEVLENGVEETQNGTNDALNDCQITDPEEPSTPEDIDEPLKEESTKIDNIPPIEEKPSEIVNLPTTLETKEPFETTKIEEQKNDEVQASKRRLSSPENDLSPTKIMCVEASPQNESISEAIETINEAEEPAEKPVVTNNILKTLLVDPKRPEANNEIIDIDDDNTIDSTSSGISLSANDSLTNSDSTKESSEIKETPEEKVNFDNSRTRRTRRSRDEQVIAGKDVVTRTKREAAQKAEETVRKNIVTLNNNSDSESSDSMVPYTPKPRAPSPASLKRNHLDELDGSSTVKKLKTEVEKENAQTTTEPIKTESKKLESVRKFFLRDNKDILKKLTQEELEELFIQKIVETITMKEEIGKLREKAKISERNQEATRVKCQQLSKQINDFDMVLNRFQADRRLNHNSNATPIKINRSVGLQVNFLTDHGVQNLRQLQTSGKCIQPKMMPKPLTNGLSPPQNDDLNARRAGIKVRSPRRMEGPVTPVSATPQSSYQPQPLISTMTPSSIALSKPVDTRTTASTGQTIHQVVINGATNSLTRTTKVLTPNNKNNAKLIDLTDEEEKKNSPPPLAAIITTSANNVPKVQNRYQRVVPATNNGIPQNLRVVQPAGQPTPTALVNNMSTMGGAPRFVVMQPAPARLVLAQNNNQIRTTTANNRGLSNIAYASVPTMSNGTVRVVPTSGTTVQLYKVSHPAPLPDVSTYPINPALKLPPPAPSLKISKVAHGIVLSWNMVLSDKFAEIASYQLYAYQEIAGMAPASSNWKKVGDVRALPLPMACTLTQFSEGNNYYFAVRAVDTHSRYGQYSQPGNISL